MAKEKDKDKKMKEKTKTTKKVKDKEKKTKKENLIKGIRKELKMVKWPTIKELVKYTGATIVLCIILVAFFQCLDIILAFIKGMFV